MLDSDSKSGDDPSPRSERPRRWWRPWMVHPLFAWCALLIPLFIVFAVPSLETARGIATLTGLLGGLFAAFVVADDLRLHDERYAPKRQWWPTGVFFIFPLFPIYTHWRNSQDNRAAPPTPSMQATTASAPPPPPVVPASWHPDPWGQARLRWWDGTQWPGPIEGTLEPPDKDAKRENGH